MKSKGYMDFNCDYWCMFCGHKVPKGKTWQSRPSNRLEIWTPASLHSEKQKVGRQNLANRCQMVIKYLVKESLGAFRARVRTNGLYQAFLDSFFRECYCANIFDSFQTFRGELSADK
jgi:hypothetical protein